MTAKNRDDDDEFDDDVDEDDEDDESTSDIPRIELERAEAHKKTMTQLTTFHQELSLISKKQPDSPLNEFKLGLINKALAKANFVLGDDFRPFPEFEMFETTRMPSASDVVLILSHYIDCFRTLRNRYCYINYWQLIGGGTLQDN